MEFNFISIGIQIESMDRMELQQSIMLKGHKFFSDACRKVACSKNSLDCSICRSDFSCHWSSIFGQKLSNDPIAIKTHQKPPLPFAFSFKNGQNQHELQCRLVVVGNAINSLDTLLSGFKEMIENDHFIPGCYLGKVSNYNLESEAIYSQPYNVFLKNRELAILSSDELFNQQQWDNSLFSISLNTPLKMFSNGRQLPFFSFSTFARAVMRRVSSLAYYYSDYEFETDYKTLSDEVENVECSSSRFKKGLIANYTRSSGIVGGGDYICHNQELYRFIKLGSFFNVGKGSSFGFGGYEVN